MSFLQSIFSVEIPCWSYIQTVASVAAALNSATSFCSFLPKILAKSNQKHRDVFITRVLELISNFETMSNVCNKVLEKYGEKKVPDMNSKVMKEVSNLKEIEERTSVKLAKAKALIAEARSFTIEEKEGNFHPILSLLFLVLSIFVLIFAIQIDNLKFKTVLLCFLFIPQILAIFSVFGLYLKVWFPVRLIKRVCSIHDSFWEKVNEYFIFQWRIIMYKPTDNNNLSDSINISFSTKK